MRGMQISGLEINGSRISILALKKRGNVLNIASLAEKELPENTIVNGVLKKPEIFIQLLSNLKKESKPRKITSPYVIVTLPDELIYLTVKPMPAIDEDQIREALEINLAEFVPGKPTEINWGYQVVEGKVSKEVLLASVKKNILDEYLTAIAAAGYIPIAIEPPSLAAMRAFNRFDKPVLILEIDQSTVMAAFLDRQAIRFSSSFAYDSKNFVGLLKKFINFCKAKSNHDEIEVLIAGIKATAIIVGDLEKNLGAPVLLAKDKMLFKNPHLNSPVILGAAMRGLMQQKDDHNLSLLPVGTAEGYEEKRALHFVGALTNLIVITCLLFAIIFYGFWGLLTYLNFTTNNQLTNANKIKPDAQTAEIQKNLTVLQPKFAYMQKVLATFKPMAPELQAIQAAAPSNVSLIGITLTKDSAVLNVTGNAQNGDALATFKDNLDGSKAFSKVTIASTNVAASGTNFTINLNLK